MKQVWDGGNNHRVWGLAIEIQIETAGSSQYLTGWEERGNPPKDAEEHLEKQEYRRKPRGRSLYKFQCFTLGVKGLLIGILKVTVSGRSQTCRKQKSERKGRWTHREPIIPSKKLAVKTDNTESKNG